VALSVTPQAFAECNAVSGEGEGVSPRILSLCALRYAGSQRGRRRPSLSPPCVCPLGFLLLFPIPFDFLLVPALEPIYL